MKSDFLELVLTCKDQREAESITRALLDEHLVACVKFELVHSKFWWRGELEEADEVKISMLSVAEYFEQIETKVSQLHSYDTFVLQAVPIVAINKDAAAWLTENSKAE